MSLYLSFTSWSALSDQGEGGFFFVIHVCDRSINYVIHTTIKKRRGKKNQRGFLKQEIKNERCENITLPFFYSTDSVTHHKPCDGR